MKVLIFGPSGSGKTYISSELKKLGVNAVDADDIGGLSSWYDGSKNKVSYRKDADKDFLDDHSFLWDREFLKKYLDQNPNIYIFGVAGNVFEMLDLFDKVYYLKVLPDIQRQRLMHLFRQNPMGQTEYQRENAVLWAQKLEEETRAFHIPFIDATLSPKKIMNFIDENAKTSIRK